MKLILVILGFILIISCKNADTIDYKLSDWQKTFSAKKNKSIYDYFMLIPDRMFDCETGKKFNESERKEQLKILDIKNGYIEYNGFGQTIALFRDNEKNKDYIAISTNHSGRGTTCGGLNILIEFNSKHSKWIYRNELFPSDKEEKKYIQKYFVNNKNDILPCCYILPRKGTEVKFIDEAGDNIYTMDWNGHRFIIK